MITSRPSCIVGSGRRSHAGVRSPRSIAEHAPPTCARPHPPARFGFGGRRRSAMRHSIAYRTLPITGIETMIACSDRSFPRHTHDQFGIGVIDAGGHASWSGRGQVEAEAGMMISVNPGEVHDGRPLGGARRSWRMLYLDPTVVADLASDITDGAGLMFTFAHPVFTSVQVRRDFESAWCRTHFASHDATACESPLLELFARLQPYSAAPRVSRASPVPGVTRACALIDADPGRQHSLRELAQNAGVSRYQLIRGFRRHTGLTPHAYVLQRRLQLARRLVACGIDLAEVAHRCGFFDQSHLTRCFTRQFGVAPGAYRSSGG